MVVMLAGALESGLTVTDLDPLDETMLREQLQRPVDARPCRRATAGLQRVLDLNCAERTRLSGEQPDHSLARAPALEPGAGQCRVHVLCPVHRSQGSVHRNE